MFSSPYFLILNEVARTKYAKVRKSNVDFFVSLNREISYCVKIDHHYRTLVESLYIVDHGVSKTYIHIPLGHQPTLYSIHYTVTSPAEQAKLSYRLGKAAFN